MTVTKIPGGVRISCLVPESMELALVQVGGRHLRGVRTRFCDTHSTWTEVTEVDSLEMTIGGSIGGNEFSVTMDMTEGANWCLSRGRPLKYSDPKSDKISHSIRVMLKLINGKIVKLLEEPAIIVRGG